MSCKSIWNLLPLYDDPELSSREREAVRAHLATCESCSNELRSIRVAQASMGALRSVEAPAKGLQKTLQAVGNQKAQRRAGWIARLRDMPSWAVGSAATGLLALFVVLLLPGVRGIDQDPGLPMPMTTMSVQEESTTLTAMEKGAMLRFAPSPDLILEVTAADPTSFIEKLGHELEGTGYPNQPVLLDHASREIQVALYEIRYEALMGLLNKMQAESPGLLTYERADDQFLPEAREDEQIMVLLRVHPVQEDL